MARNYKDSDYALNKYSNGIVYRLADGIVEIMLADYLAENPDKSERDFHLLKKRSDAIYLEQAQKDNAQTYKNSPLGELDESLLYQSSSPEDLLIGMIDAQEEAVRRQQRLTIAKRTLDKLTETQRRRYLLHVIDGLSTHQIAEIEGTNQKTVYESLQAAEKKIKKVLASN